MHWIIIIGLVMSILPMVVMFAYSENNDNRIHQQVQKRLAAGEKANRLINEQSPYLLQHLFNPVAWYPWGEESFAKAKREDKPIFFPLATRPATGVMSWPMNPLKILKSPPSKRMFLNVAQTPMKEFSGRNILYRAQNNEEIAKSLSSSKHVSCDHGLISTTRLSPPGTV